MCQIKCESLKREVKRSGSSLRTTSSVRAVRSSKNQLKSEEHGEEGEEGGEGNATAGSKIKAEVLSVSEKRFEEDVCRRVADVTKTT